MPRQGKDVSLLRAARSAMTATPEQLQWLRYGLDGNPPGYSPHWDAIRALLEEREELQAKFFERDAALQAALLEKGQAQREVELALQRTAVKHAQVKSLEDMLRESEAQRKLTRESLHAKLAEAQREIERLKAQLADEQEQHRLGVLNDEAQLAAEVEKRTKLEALPPPTPRDRINAADEIPVPTGHCPKCGAAWYASFGFCGVCEP
jgi:chromosome segregation ATPase